MPKASSSNKQKSPPKKNQMRRTHGERPRVSPSDKDVSQRTDGRAKGMVHRSPRRDKRAGTNKQPGAAAGLG